MMDAVLRSELATLVVHALEVGTAKSEWDVVDELSTRSASTLPQSRRLSRPIPARTPTHCGWRRRTT